MICQFKKVDYSFDFFIIDFSIVSGYVPKVFYKFFLRYHHSISVYLRKCLPHLCLESSPEMTRLPPPQLTPNWSLTCPRLPDFAFSAVFPSSLSPFFPPFSFLLFVRKFLPETGTETTKDPFIVTTAPLFDETSSWLAKRTSVCPTSIFPALCSFPRFFQKRISSAAFCLDSSVSFSDSLLCCVSNLLFCNVCWNTQSCLKSKRKNIRGLNKQSILPSIS